MLHKESHYQQGGIETIAIIKCKLTPEQYEGFLLGNIIKYATRINTKNQKNEDIKKLDYYATRLTMTIDSKD